MAAGGGAVPEACAAVTGRYEAEGNVGRKRRSGTCSRKDMLRLRLASSDQLDLLIENGQQ